LQAVELTITLMLSKLNITSIITDFVYVNSKELFVTICRFIPARKNTNGEVLLPVFTSPCTDERKRYDAERKICYL